MYNIKERQIQKAYAKHKERFNTIELLKKTGVKLSNKEIENILIFGDIRGACFLCHNDHNDPNYPDLPEEFTDYEILKEFLG